MLLDHMPNQEIAQLKPKSIYGLSLAQLSSLILLFSYHVIHYVTCPEFDIPSVQKFRGMFSSFSCWSLALCQIRFKCGRTAKLIQQCKKITRKQISYNFSSTTIDTKDPIWTIFDIDVWSWALESQVEVGS